MATPRRRLGLVFQLRRRLPQQMAELSLNQPQYATPTSQENPRLDVNFRAQKLRRSATPEALVTTIVTA
jgi:hypothetical protein